MHYEWQVHTVLIKKNLILIFVTWALKSLMSTRTECLELHQVYRFKIRNGWTDFRKDIHWQTNKYVLHKFYKGEIVVNIAVCGQIINSEFFMNGVFRNVIECSALCPRLASYFSYLGFKCVTYYLVVQCSKGHTHKWSLMVYLKQH